MITPLLLTGLLFTAAGPSAEETLDHASDALLRGLLGSAQLSLQEAVRLDPDNLDALLALALLELDTEDYQSAIPHLQRALSLDPYNDDARVDLTLALWRQGDLGGAREILSQLVTRHPEWETTVELKEHLDANQPAPPLPSPWQRAMHVGMSAGYDSNIGLKSAAVAVSNQSAPLLNLDASLALLNTRRTRPFSLYAHAATSALLGDQDSALTDYLPTLAGLTAIARTFSGRWDSAFQLNYSEIFTSFTTYNQRLINPIATTETALPGSQTLRLLASADLRFHQQSEIKEDYTLQVAVRDTLHLDRGRLAVQGFARRNLGQSTATDPTLAAAEIIDFVEWGASLYGDLRVSVPVVVFGILDAQQRDLALSDSQETTLSAQLGARWEFDEFALHAQYAYQKNDNTQADSYRDFERHQVQIGIRYWLE